MPDLFLTFVESLEMTFSQYTETCGIIIDYLKIVGEGIEDYSQKAIRNLFDRVQDSYEEQEL